MNPYEPPRASQLPGELSEFAKTLLLPITLPLFLAATLLILPGLVLACLDVLIGRSER